MIVTRIVTKPVLESEIYCDRQGKDKKGTETVFLLFFFFLRHFLFPTMEKMSGDGKSTTSHTCTFSQQTTQLTLLDRQPVEWFKVFLPTNIPGDSLSEERRHLPSICRRQRILQISTAIFSDIFIACRFSLSDCGEQRNHRAGKRKRAGKMIWIKN